MSSKVTDAKVVRKYQQLSSSAKDRGLLFSLSLKRVRQLLEAKTCFYTGIKFVEEDPNLGRSIDQVLPAQGYTDDNTVACIMQINRLKANLGYEDVVAIYKGMTKHLDKKTGSKSKPTRKRKAATKKQIPQHAVLNTES